MVAWRRGRGASGRVDHRESGDVGARREAACTIGGVAIDGAGDGIERVDVVTVVSCSEVDDPRPHACRDRLRDGGGAVVCEPPRGERSARCVRAVHEVTHSNAPAEGTATGRCRHTEELETRVRTDGVRRVAPVTCLLHLEAAARVEDERERHRACRRRHDGVAQRAVGGDRERDDGVVRLRGHHERLAVGAQPDLRG